MQIAWFKMMQFTDYEVLVLVYPEFKIQNSERVQMSELMKDLKDKYLRSLRDEQIEPMTFQQACKGMS